MKKLCDLSTICEPESLDLSVENVSELREFFIKNFGFNCLAGKGEKMLILADGEGFVLVLTRLKSSDPRVYPSLFHIGFLLDTPGAIEDKYEDLPISRKNIKRPPQKTGAARCFFSSAG